MVINLNRLIKKSLYLVLPAFFFAQANCGDGFPQLDIMGSTALFQQLSEGGSKFTVSKSQITTTESGGTATFTVVLNSAPTDTVLVPLVASDTNEATISPTALVFNASNWETPQTVTATGVDDLLSDGDKAYSVLLMSTTSNDDNFDGVDPPDVIGMNTDDDFPGFKILSMTGSATEAGGTLTFTVELGSQPLANVVIPSITSSNTAEATVSPATMTFTPSNWNTPQTVTVSGVDDVTADGNQAVTIVLAAATSTDSDYSGLDPADVAVTNYDNEYTLSSGTTTYASISGTGTTVTFTNTDDGSSSISLPFTFRYMGSDYTSVDMSTNGLVGFGSPASITTYINQYATAAPNNILMPWWDDLYQDIGSAAYYEVSGTSPNRVMTLEWKDWVYLGDLAHQFNFQVKLHEGTNVVEFVYGGMSGVGTLTMSASIGLEDAIGGANHMLEATTGSRTVGVTTINYTSFPASGFYYRFTPP